jgi:kumamolisin
MEQYSNLWKNRLANRKKEPIMANVPPQGFIQLTGSERQLPPDTRQIGPVDPHEHIEVSVYLRDPAASSPPQHGRRLSRAEYRSIHQAAPDDLAKVEAFAHQHGLTVTKTNPVTRKVALAGSAAAMTKAFATELHRYEHPGGTFRGRTGHLHVPSELEPVITGVFGLDDRPQARPHFQTAELIDRSTASAQKKHATSVSYTPPQVAQIYDFPTDLDGSNECIALIELGGGYRDQDLETYFQQLHIPTPQVVSVSVDGAQNSPTGNANSADGEVVLDIEVAGSVAPKARIAVYFAPNTDAGFLDAVNQAIHDTTNAPSVISISWGAAEVYWTTQAMQNMDLAFQTAGTLGVTVLCASGDNGSSDGVHGRKAHVDFPASSPNASGCGGTRLSATNNETWQSEVVWNDGRGRGATGGGISDVFPLPTWQANANVPKSVNGHHVGRGVPDIAGDADPQSGYQVYVDGQSLVFGGTSAVAPLWAGLVALLNQKRGQPIGFLNALLYQNYQNLTQAHAFHDITSGNNGSYKAGSGWDACTGLGTPDGKMLIDALITLQA